MVTWEKKQNFRSPRFYFCLFFVFYSTRFGIHSRILHSRPRTSLRMVCVCFAVAPHNRTIHLCAYAPFFSVAFICCHFITVVSIFFAHLHPHFLLPTMKHHHPPSPSVLHSSPWLQPPRLAVCLAIFFFHQMPPLPVQCSCACSKRRCGCPKVHQSLSPLSCDTVSSSTIPPLPRSVLRPDRSLQPLSSDASAVPRTRSSCFQNDLFTAPYLPLCVQALLEFHAFACSVARFKISSRVALFCACFYFLSPC